MALESRNQKNYEMFTFFQLPILLFISRNQIVTQWRKLSQESVKVECSTHATQLRYNDSQHH